tara:strand:- start:1401 stop:2024 length:624 start_codon:yes stop_codon:yes gene_type:complete
MSFNKLYKGKVIFDSDRLTEGDTVPLNRVKVYISGVTPAGTESFKQPRGATNENTITQETLDIIGTETYAWVMQPVMGAGTGAKYNANTDILTVADTGDINDLNAQPPAEAYSNICDGFRGGNNIGTAGVNINSSAYSPDNRSNAYKGMLATPRVGATVILSFIHGMREEPIVLGILPGAADINSIAGVGTADEIYPNTPLAYSNLA